jgi:hypothetical protein
VQQSHSGAGFFNLPVYLRPSPPKDVFCSEHGNFSCWDTVLRMQSNMSLAICDLLIVRDYAKYHTRYTPSFSVHMVGKKLAKPAVSGLIAAN